MVRHCKRFLSNPAFITVVAFALRMGILYYTWRTSRLEVRSFLPYGFELGRIASSIASGKGFSSPLRFMDTGPSAWFTPIYPYLVAGIFKIWGIFSDASKLLIEVLNCMFSALTVIPIYEISRKAFGKGVAIAASWTWVVLPSALFFPIFWIWDTACAALFLTLILWATLEVVHSKSALVWAGYGALWAVGVLINPSLFSLFPFLAGWALWQSRAASTSWLKLGAAAVLVFAIGLVPWTVRNYRVFGKFVPLRSNFGLELWLGNNPKVPDTWTPWLHPNDDPKEAAKYERMGEMAYMEEKQHEAFVFMRTHPADTLNFMFRRFVENWLGQSDSPADVWSNGPWYVKGFVALNVFLSLATWMGAMFAYRTRRPGAFPLVAVPLIFPLVFYLTHLSLRYRFPMDPIMVVLATYAVAHIVSVLRGQRVEMAEGAGPVASLPTA